MTYEEKIKDAIGCIKRHRRGLSDYNGDWSFFDTAIEALEKQIPKKPKKRVRGVYSDDCNDWLYDEEWDRCPTCRKDKEVYKGWDYCPLCGQALDWSDDEET